MSDNRIRRVAFVHILLLSFLAGLSLSVPLRLADYFYEKPQIDFWVNGLLFVFAIFLSGKFLKRTWVQKFQGMYLLQWTIGIVAIGWLPLEYWLFSTTEWVHIVSYGLILWTGLACVTGVKLVWKKRPLFQEYFLFVLVFGVGCWLGFSYHVVQLTYVVLLAFTFTTILLSSSVARIVRYLPIVFIILMAVFGYAVKAPQFFAIQHKYHDKVVFSKETRFQRVDITEWKGNYWFYQNGINQFSSIDSWLYYEPFVHPVMHLTKENPKALVIGGERGLLVKELTEYKSVEAIDLLPIDHELLEMVSNEPLLKKMNENVFSSKQMAVKEGEAFQWLDQHQGQYDVIFVDVPDPVDIELNQYYTLEFYNLCYKALKENGLMITQAGSPYYATKAFDCVRKTMEKSGFSVAAFHNQVLSLGEWGWVLGARSMNAGSLENNLKSLIFDQVTTQWINQEAMNMMLSFGKPYVLVDTIAVNTLKNPVIYQYYNTGNWRLQ